MSTRSKLGLALALTLASCRAGPSPGEAGDEEAGPSDPVPTPRFSDPANLSKVIRADHDQPIELGIADARADLWVEIDGHRFAPSPGGVVERIGEEGLRLRVEGSMIALLHDVVLAQRDGADTLRSESLTLGIVGSKLDSIPSASDSGSGLGAGEHVGARGNGEQALLGLLSGETLTLRRGQASAAAWAWSEVFASVELPGIASAPDSWAAIVEAGQPWIAWRVAKPDGGSLIRMRIGEAGEVQTLADSDEPASAALFGSHEHASLDAVAWIGRTALISARAVRDVERATPGDRVLLVRRVDPAGEPFEPQLVRGQGQRDIDSLMAVIDLGSEAPTMLVRLGRALPWRLRLSDSGVPELGEEPGAIELADDLRWLGGVDAAFGSRQAFWIADDGLRVGVLRIDRLLDRVETSEVELSEPASGPLALAVLAGVPTIVIPHGDQAMQVIRSTGAGLQLADLSGPSCDELAVLVSLEGSRAGALPFACLRAGELRLGALTSP